MTIDDKKKAEETPLTAEEERDMERFIRNSQGYCEKIYRKKFEDGEIDELREEIKRSNEKIKKVRTDWDIK